MHGSKAQNLETLATRGFSVPAFYTISSSTLNKIGSEKTRKKLLKDLDKWRHDSKCTTVAVRSSASGEDSEAQSFAGQFKSVMNVKTNEEFLKALQAVAASRATKAYSSSNSTVHVIVQEYIDPDTAGVVFTVNPSNGLSELLVNAVSGHGSKAVDGEHVYSTSIERDSGQIRHDLSSSILTESQLRQLQRTALDIETIFGFVQDVEWAFKGDKLYILQARPITKIGHLQVWDSSNIGESFPGIVSPLTFSISRRGYELVYKSQGYAGGLGWYDIQQNHRYFYGMVGLFAGRMYYNLANWYRFIGLFPSNAQNQKYLDEQLQTVGEAVYMPPSTYPLSYKIKFYLRVLKRTVFFGRERRSYYKQLNEIYREYESLPPGTDLFLLMQRYWFIEQRVMPIMGRSADNDFFVMIYHGQLKQKLKKWLPDNARNATDFIGSLHDVISAKQATLLNEIAAYISEDEKARQFLGADQYQKLDEHLLQSACKEPLLEYRDKFLHRFAEDQKIEAMNPLLSPEGFYGLIRTYTQLDNEEVKRRQNTALSNEKERGAAARSNLSLFQKLVYRLLISRLKHHLRIREHNRLLRGKAYAYLRELFQKTGKHMFDQGIIEKASDVYFLDVEEVGQLINGTGYSDDLQTLIDTRKKAYKEYEKLTPPSRFITNDRTDIVPLDFNKKADATKVADTKLKGTISSPGDVEGIVLVLDKPIIPKKPFDILVVSHTDPGWTPLIALAKGLVIEHGGILSHAAIVTRELGIPSIIGVEGATNKLKNGSRVRINTAAETVEIL